MTQFKLLLALSSFALTFSANNAFSSDDELNLSSFSFTTPVSDNSSLRQSVDRSQTEQHNTTPFVFPDFTVESPSKTTPSKKTPSKGATSTDFDFGSLDFESPSKVTPTKKKETSRKKTRTPKKGATSTDFDFDLDSFDFSSSQTNSTQVEQPTDFDLDSFDFSASKAKDHKKKDDTKKGHKKKEHGGFLQTIEDDLSSVLGELGDIFSSHTDSSKKDNKSGDDSSKPEVLTPVIEPVVESKDPSGDDSSKPVDLTPVIEPVVESKDPSDDDSSKPVDLTPVIEPVVSSDAKTSLSNQDSSESSENAPVSAFDAAVIKKELEEGPLNGKDFDQYITNAGTIIQSFTQSGDVIEDVLARLNPNLAAAFQEFRKALNADVDGKSAGETVVAQLQAIKDVK